MITALYRRKIKPGTEYNDLIPDSACHSNFRGDGDTFHSMDLIQEFITDYSDQVSKLAPLLKGKTVEKTVTNIYNFIYNHIQYKADGAAQEIRSPQCTWHSRNRGADCKSFSVLAGALCKELGLPYSIRKIQQPGDSDGTYSHVYIIVHRNNKSHLVIDATKHENTESFYLKKHDISMKHYGLNASRIATNQKQCAFQDYFGRICNTLSNDGVCNTQINKLKDNVNNHVKRTGHYPLVTVEVDTVYINGTANKFRSPNGATVLIARKNEGLNSAAAAVGSEIISGALKDGVGSILGKIKGTIGKLWKKLTCKIRNSAWDTKMANAYASAIEQYFETALNSMSSKVASNDSYSTPNNLGESTFTKDLNRYILELWSEYAKYDYEKHTSGSTHNSCSKQARDSAMQAAMEYYKGMQEVYSLVKSSGYPLEHHMVLTNPVMNFSFNNLWDFQKSVDYARGKGYNRSIPQIQLPKITVNLTELAKLNNPKPTIPGGDFITAPDFGNGSGNTGGDNKIKPPKTGVGNSFTKAPPSSIAKIRPGANQQKASFGFLPALLIAGAGYSVYKSQQTKKAKKK